MAMATTVELVGILAAGLGACGGLGYAAFAMSWNTGGRRAFRREYHTAPPKRLPGDKYPAAGIAAAAVFIVVGLMFVAMPHLM